MRLIIKSNITNHRMKVGEVFDFGRWSPFGDKLRSSNGYQISLVDIQPFPFVFKVKENFDKYNIGDIYFLNGILTNKIMGKLDPIVLPSYKHVIPDDVKDGTYVRIKTASCELEGIFYSSDKTFYILNNEKGHPSDDANYKFKRVFLNKSLLSMEIKVGIENCIRCDSVLGNGSESGMCQVCNSNLKKCASCRIPEDIHNPFTLGFCELCKIENLINCSCGEWARHSDMINFEGGVGCKKCIKKISDLCSQCSKTIKKGLEGGLCQRCSGCDIQNHDYKPNPHFFGKGHVFMGIELEVESTRDRTPMQRVAKKPWNYLKQDGSIRTGFEIVSHPLSYEWVYENDTMIKDYLGSLIKSGARSFDTDSCGIHIHLSKREENGDEMTDEHFYNLLKIVYSNPTFILAISQRKKEELDTWAKVFPGSGSSYEENQHAIRMMAKGKFYSKGKYHAVNVTEKTMEFRIFKGTLHFMSFMKNFDFVHAIYMYSKNCTDTSAKGFVDWVNEQKGYIYLKAFMLEKKAIIEKSVGCKPIEGAIPQIEYHKSLFY